MPKRYYIGTNRLTLDGEIHFPKRFDIDLPYSFASVKTREEAIDIYTYLSILQETDNVLIFDDGVERKLDQANVFWCDGEKVLGVYITKRFEFKVDETLFKTLKPHLTIIPVSSKNDEVKPTSGSIETSITPFSINIERKLKRRSPINLCLCMIVKNESKILKRCFDSVVEYLDHWIIFDTGSSDGTQDLIKDYFKEHNIEGSLISSEWFDFGKNRTMLVQKAIRELHDKNFYLLLLDADFEMRIKEPNFKQTLDINCEGFRIQYEGNNDYYRALIISADYPWLFKHKTHEYLTCSEPTRIENSYCMSIIEHPDGGAKSDKFERDIRLLEGEIKEAIDKREKPEARLFFYLAQSYECVGKLNQSIEYYESYGAQNNPWAEEHYIALVRAAEHRFRRGDSLESCAGYYIKAYLNRPTRLEALAKLVRHYQWRERYKEAYAYGIMYKQYYKNYPTDILFIDRNCHLFELWDALAIASFYAEDYQESLECTRKIIQNGQYGQHYSRVMKNAGYAIEKTIPSSISKHPVHISSIIGPLSEGNIKVKQYRPSKLMDKFNPSSPSIVRYKDGYLMNIRCVNYTINEQQGWRYKYEGDIRTENILCELDSNLNIVSERLVSLGEIKLPYSCGIDGLEDIRLFWNKGKLKFTATSLQVKSRGAKCMVLGTLSIKDDISIVTELQTLDGFGGNEAQKNWTYIEAEDNIRLVYSFAPFIILKYDGNNVGLDKTILSVSNKWRGSSQAIPYKEGWLTLVHTSNFPRYSHTFVYFDETTIIKWSDPFYFEKFEIEFVCGTCWNHDGSELIICFSRLDGTANTMIIPTLKIRELL